MRCRKIPPSFHANARLIACSRYSSVEVLQYRKLSGEFMKKVVHGNYYVPPSRSSGNGGSCGICDVGACRRQNCRRTFRSIGVRMRCPASVKMTPVCRHGAREGLFFEAVNGRRFMGVSVRKPQNRPSLGGCFAYGTPTNRNQKDFIRVVHRLGV